MTTPEDRARMRAYYAANKERWQTPEHKAKDAEYRAANHERRRADAQRRRQVSRQKVAQIKSQPCADCGVSYPWYVMDLDHVHGEKVMDVSSMIDNGASWRRIEAEIAKCDVVCSNCHRIRTHQRRGTRNGEEFYSEGD